MWIVLRPKSSNIYPQFLHRFACPVMPPAGGLVQISQLVFERGRCLDVFPQVGKFVQLAINDIIAVPVLPDAVGGFFFFPLKAAEELIKENEEAAIVAVEVFDVHAMMHTVVGGRHQNLFEKSHLLHKLGVVCQPDKLEPCLKDDVYERMNAEDGYPEVERERHKRIEHAAADACGEVKMFG